jgi:hypothetical protein
MIRRLALNLQLELGAAFILAACALLAAIRWHEPGCAVLIVYFAWRLIVYGSH